MKKSFVLVAITAVVAAAALTAVSPLTAVAADWKSFRPAEHAGRVGISVGGKEQTYYHVTAEEPVTFTVEGPTRIKVLTRARVPNDVETLAYGILVSRDGVLVETVEKQTYPKDSAFYIAFNHFRPGVIRRVYIDVPTGRHGYELRAAGRHSVDVRLFESASSTPSRVSIAPSAYGSVETLHYRDKELTYYVATKDVPVVLDVVGPTAVKVNTRLLYDATMLGDQAYVVGVTPAGGSERLYRIESEPSQTVLCRDRSDVVPGALRHFMLEVPPGPATYTFRLADTLAGGLGLKFYIPRGDLSNEP